MAETAGRGAGEPGDVIELEPSNPAHGGEFVARIDGRVVFVSDTLDGERVLARLTDTSHAGFWRAQTLRVLEPSPWRRRHIWAQADVAVDPAERPGGAEYGHIALEHQRSLKRRVLEEALRRFAGLERPVEVAAAPGDETAGGIRWRTRVRLYSGPDGFGPYAARSRRVIPVADLPLAAAPVAAAAPLRRRAGGPEGLDAAAAVDVVQDGEGAVLQYRRKTASHRASRDGRLRTFPPGHAVLHHTVAGLPFEVAAGGFWQVHRQAPEVLFAAVGRAAGRPDPDAEHFDLYGGVGLLAAALAVETGPGVCVTSVESAEPATQHARHNLAGWPGARAVTARVDDYLARLDRTAGAARRARIAAGTVVLDPPRSGAGKTALRHLARLAPARIVYVACDPVALARDVGLLRESGFTLTDISAVDLFPHTHHVEAVAVLRRR